ncbi:uncharacterized protein [Diadema antillarum]|uniref:uncharacterized protein n=2 Tax=Diadema antillarum TaxID=105358 RepID=UPI003A89CBC4
MATGCAGVSNEEEESIPSTMQEVAGELNSSHGVEFDVLRSTMDRPRSPLFMAECSPASGASSSESEVCTVEVPKVGLDSRCSCGKRLPCVEEFPNGNPLNNGASLPCEMGNSSTSLTPVFNTNGFSPVSSPYSEWDELFALAEYRAVGQCQDHMLASGEYMSCFNEKFSMGYRHGETEESLTDCNSSSSDLFDVFDNPIAHSDTSDDVLSSQDSESVVSEPDSDTSSKPRRSSLRDPKRPKTPPGTPNKKTVRFADALGLSLETVRDILEMEPCVTSPPPSFDLSDQRLLTKPILRMCFEQPGGRPDFLRRLYEQMVCLENVVVSDMTVLGTIKVRNMSFHKEVRVRYSYDDWSSHVNIMALYVQGSCDGPTDRFSFGFSVPARHTGVGDKVFFAVFYRVDGQEYWDSNHGNNYFLLVDEAPVAR